MVYGRDDIKQLGSIMGIWAHPDDESWSSAGIMATARENGQDVMVLSATRGDAGKTADEANWPQNQLHRIREEEFKKALEATNVQHGILLDYKDGALPHASATTAVDEIRQHISLFQPDTILTFEEHGITGHGDHRTISQWARQATRASNKRITVYGVVETQEGYEDTGKKADDLFNVYFAIDKPVLYKRNDVDICYELPDDIKAKKRAALLAHASQTSGMFNHPDGENLLEGALQREHFIRLD